MSDRLFDEKMRQAISKLEELLSIEIGNNPCPRTGSLVSCSGKQVKSIMEAYEHFAYLYVRYIMICNQFEECYHTITQPQKRVECKQFLHLCAAHTINIRDLLVRWYPPNPDCKVEKRQYQPPFPWEYINLNDELKSSGLTHEESWLRIPRYFKEENGVQHTRNSIITGYMEMMFKTILYFGEPIELTVNTSTIELDKLDVRDEGTSDFGINSHQQCFNSNRTCLNINVNRKQKQNEHRHLYEVALNDIQKSMQNEEFLIRQELVDARTAWVTQLIADGKDVPENLEGYYANKNNETDSESKKISSKGIPDKSKRSDSEEKIVPDLNSNSIVTEKLLEHINIFKTSSDPGDFSSPFNLDAARHGVRKTLKTRIRKEVDMNLIDRLKKYNMTNSKAKTKEKKGKAKKTKGKSKKGGKALPGAKLADIKRMDIDQMLAFLIEHGIVRFPKNVNIQDLLGDFDTCGGVQQEHQSSKPWIPNNPSYAQLRAFFTEYCVLPLGSREVREHVINNIKSVMMYGPSGSGKTLVVNAIANEINGIVFDLSPKSLNGKFEGKSSQTKLIHMVFMVAKEICNAPAIIYLDSCDEFMLNSKNKKKAGKGGAARFMKDLQTYRNQALQKDDRVLIIGTTCQPDRIDVKQCRKFFEKYIYFPYPDYSDRIKLWKHFISNRLLDLDIDLDHSKSIDFSSLSLLSEGFTGGSIKLSVLSLSNEEVIMPKTAKSNTSTASRSSENDSKNLDISNGNDIVFKFLKGLEKCSCDEDLPKFADFTIQITKLKEMRQLVSSDQDQNSELKFSRIAMLGNTR